MPAYVNPRLPRLWHGGDYNPEQWQEYPEVLEEDIRLMKRAHCNVLSIGIFAWAALEPEEGRFEFGWFDRIFERFEENDLYIDLATPSGARPRWLAQQYPEVLRTNAARQKQLCGQRHNHCPTSPVYREKVRRINTELALRYGGRKALVLWHVSNEYCGECHCPLCQAAFREFLRTRYGTLDALNHAWWTSFWGRTYTDWEQIESSSPNGEGGLNGLYLDWRRFVTAQTIGFMSNEIAPLRAYAPGIPVTTNMMGFQPVELNLQELAKHLDIASWDSYPAWHSPDGDGETAQYVAMLHDLTRGFKPGKPFLLMESSPAMSSWKPVHKQKRPGMHNLSCQLAIASGSDSAMYFQWRKGRGGCEKFLGAVVGHDGTEHTKTFRDVTAVGERLEALRLVAGSLFMSSVAIIADWENWWGLYDACCFDRNKKEEYWEFVRAHHRAFFTQGVNTDLVAQTTDFTPYKLVVAPVLHLVLPGVAQKLEEYVAGGGTLVLTFGSGMVNESDLCFLGGAPGPLRKLAGIWAEEMDCLYPDDSVTFTATQEDANNLRGTFSVQSYCEVVHTEGAEVLATYDNEYYAGMPALTRNRFGKGSVYYLAAHTGADFLSAFYAGQIAGLQLPRATCATMPEGVFARLREGEGERFLFLLNFTAQEQIVDLYAEKWFAFNGKPVAVLTLPPFGEACLCDRVVV